MTLEFTVYGTARPQGALAIGTRKDGGHFLRPGRGAKDLGAWKRAIKDKAGENATGAATRGPVSVRGTFHLPRPASHYGTGRNAGKLKESAPAFPANRAYGDVDKLARALLDALAGVSFLDDAQVVLLNVRKLYADDGPARCDIEIRTLDELDVLYDRAQGVE